MILIRHRGIILEVQFACAAWTMDLSEVANQNQIREFCHRLTVQCGAFSLFDLLPLSLSSVVFLQSVDYAAIIAL